MIFKKTENKSAKETLYFQPHTCRSNFGRNSQLECASPSNALRQTLTAFTPNYKTLTALSLSTLIELRSLPIGVGQTDRSRYAC